MVKINKTNAARLLDKPKIAYGFETGGKGIGQQEV